MRRMPRAVRRGAERTKLHGAAFWQRVQHEALEPWRARKPVRRAVSLWVLSFGLLALLSFLQIRALRPFYTKIIGQPGGVYSEGIVGSISTINPVLSDSGANADAAHLVFSGLTRYNRQGEIEGDLAESWSIANDKRTYTFILRPNIRWHDGQVLNSADVAFTIGLIQNPATRSPLAAAWKGVEVSTPDTRTVRLVLPVRYDAFINSTTVGILPQHILGSVAASNLRVSDFNQSPIGSGPFKISNFDTESGSVNLEAFDNYFRGRPQLDGFVLKVYANQADMQAAFRKQQIMGMARVANSSGGRYRNASVHRLDIPEEVAVFMRNRSSILQDANVRTALALATDRSRIVDSTMGGTAQVITVPALPDQLAEASTYSMSVDLAAARDKLDAAGWKLSGGSVRIKDGKELRLKLVTVQTDDYQAIAKQLASQYDKLGVRLDIDAVDVATLQRSYITPRDYDILLYGINTGLELDPYSYWHSSQAQSPGLNVSQYSSKTADKALESARATTDDQVRAIRVKSFIDSWVKDAPAIMLYTPDYLYVTKTEVGGINDGSIATAADRFYDVHTWTVNSKRVPR